MYSQTDADQVRYRGEKGPLFKIALVTGLWTLLTLGIYRFWQKTRIRRYIWSAAEFEGDSFEYTGTGLEKFLGFLLAVVFLAIYLGIIQIVLFYFGISVFVEPETFEQAITQIAAIYISAFAVVPFILFAIYRARRYKMARTRWRGIRFGMEKGAWGYVWRAILYWLLTAVTLGALLPLKTFRLEQYMTDRSWYGDTRFTQGGRWTGLYPAMKHLGIGIALIVGSGLFGAMESPVLAGLLAFVGFFWFSIGSVYYSVRGFAYLATHKTLGDAVGFQSDPKTKTVIGTYIVGALMIFALMAVAGGIIGYLTAAPVLAGAEPGLYSIVMGVLGYLLLLILAQALGLIFISQPILSHYVETLRITNAEALAGITQREADAGADAEGFADALDVGGAF